MRRALVRSRSALSTILRPRLLRCQRDKVGARPVLHHQGSDAPLRDGGCAPIVATFFPATTRCGTAHAQAATDALASLRLSPALSGRHRLSVWDHGAPGARPPWLRCTDKARPRASPIRPGVHARMTRVARGADPQGCHGGVLSTCPLPHACRAGLPTGKGRRLEDRGRPGRRRAGRGQCLTLDQGQLAPRVRMPGDARACFPKGLHGSLPGVAFGRRPHRRAADIVSVEPNKRTKSFIDSSESSIKTSN